MLRAHEAQLDSAMEDIRGDIAKTQADLDGAILAAGDGVGGSIVLVDLAGADYDGRDVGEGVTKVGRYNGRPRPRPRLRSLT